MYATWTFEHGHLIVRDSTGTLLTTYPVDEPIGRTLAGIGDAHPDAWERSATQLANAAV